VEQLRGKKRHPTIEDRVSDLSGCERFSAGETGHWRGQHHWRQRIPHGKRFRRTQSFLRRPEMRVLSKTKKKSATDF